MAIETFEYKAEMQQLLRLIIHSLYTNRDVFLRELVSNASDALNKIRYRMLTDRDVTDPDATLQIRITADPATNTLIIEDSGVGMTRDELIGRLGTVASSGTKAFLEQLKQDEAPLDGASLIGQFGVGFYASFMVADEVIVETKHADIEEPAFRWTSDGSGSYSLEEIKRKARGTRIELKLKEGATEYGQEYKVQQIIRKYSNFVDFPIYVGDSRTNTVEALWRKNKRQVDDAQRNEFYTFFTGQQKEPDGHLHLTLEGDVPMRALLFIPAEAPPRVMAESFDRQLHLYSNGVFIQDDCKPLLPEYLRFVQGVVDLEDIPLNVSRETTQQSPLLDKARKILTGRVLGLLEDWAKDDVTRFERFHKNFGGLIKWGVNEDFAQRDRLAGLTRFPTTKTEGSGVASLQEVVDRMGPDQVSFYYATGEHLPTLRADPKLEIFKQKGIEVILAADPVDGFTLPAIGTFAGKSFESVEKADLDVGPSLEIPDDGPKKDRQKRLVKRFKKVLGDRVSDVQVSKRLVDSPAVLVSGKDGMDAQTERMMQMMDATFKASPRTLEVNMNHALLHNLSTLDIQDKTEELDQAIEQLFEAALLLDGRLENPTELLRRMTQYMVKATSV